MRHLEDELRQALRREEAPPGLASQVLARIEAQRVREQGGWWHRFRLAPKRPTMRWAVVGTGACVLIAMAVLQLSDQRFARLPWHAETGVPTTQVPSNQAGYQGPVSGETNVAGEIAKQQLMRAMYIASASLNSVQRAIYEDARGRNLAPSQVMHD